MKHTHNTDFIVTSMILIQFRPKQKLIQNDNNNKCNPIPMFNIIQGCKARSKPTEYFINEDRKIEHSDWQPDNKQQLNLKVQRKVTTQQTVLLELVYSLIGWFEKTQFLTIWSAVRKSCLAAIGK